ncbi:GvpL/GvpF family gas vesicle protein [Sutcliffiella horikoshii]|uniref:GvpL/GvpF family gas vesicle protein n=1 Tax=Sutcliffiella horikoshii TaxID=79883 RepID=UPI001CFECBCF|nr:GvpL/GvpF family gas vesicle protein [Sutcliffiella horikoshii]
MENNLGYYTFCVIPNEQKKIELGEVVLEGRTSQLLTIEYKEFSMVVTKAPIKIYHPKKENLLTHQNVVSSLMERTTVIPMSFGNVFETEADVEFLMKSLYTELQNIYKKIENKIEVGLKIIGKEDWLKAEINKNQKAMKLKEKISGKSEAASYYERIELGDMAQKFMKEKMQICMQEVFLPLAEKAVSAKQNETIGGKMLINASFLIERDHEEEFDELVNKIYEKWQDKVEFKYTGPWPAYNFIDIKLKAKEA